MYTVEEMRQQLVSLWDAIQRNAPAEARSLLFLEYEQAERILENGETDCDGRLTPREYAYSTISRLAGMVKAAHYLLVELPMSRRPYVSARKYLGL